MKKYIFGFSKDILSDESDLIKIIEANNLKEAHDKAYNFALENDMYYEYIKEF